MPDSVCLTEINVQGVVQGVGFRPFVYNLARECDLVGTVSNTGHGVVIEAQGSRASIDIFIRSLKIDPPPLARITSLQENPAPSAKKFADFSILASSAPHRSRALIPADVAICSDCLNDILSPGDRRFSYPFTNCTNCGPRFTIVESTPYDRTATSMKQFQLCQECQAEYDDPEDRRFHAQPNACPRCGPELSLHDDRGTKIDTTVPLRELACELSRGRIAAVRGLGGFHLLVDAGSEEAVARLRRRKGRRLKPLAVMVKNLAEIKRICYVTDAAVRLLQGPERPIVLLARRDTSVSALTPGLDELGVMLPYTPLHHLLFEEPDCPSVLVMTSGNRSGAPIFTANGAAVEGLSAIADCFLLHNRDILTRVDDSVARPLGAGGKIQILRRARGYVPEATALTWDLQPMLGCGAGMKNTFCLSRGREAFLSQHIGDLFTVESLDFYRESIYHFKRLLQVSPVAVACDLHPDYLSTHHANELGLPLYRVQHHHAHAVAVLVEHGIQEKVLALILDGTGLGDDGSIWGGEVLETDCHGYRRIGSLMPMLLPGGDAAALEPWRMGMSLLYAAGKDPSAGPQLADESKRKALWQMMTQGFNCPVTSSCGRFFDGIAALLGVCQVADYEGQAAMELEALARRAMHGQDLTELLDRVAAATEIEEGQQRLLLVQQHLVSQVLLQQKAGVERAEIALFFHLSLIHSLVRLLEKLAGQTGLKQVVLGGGCMQNMILLQGLFILLEQRGFTVFSGERIPVNDGGIALGQAVIGGLAHVSGSSHEGD